ncbi:MAG: cytosolic long-chain acyl-CoA thioester hydrolase family protein, partial [uncultured Sphingomonas sp.]
DRPSKEPDPTSRTRPKRHQRQRPHLRWLGPQPDGHCGGHRRLPPGQWIGRDCGDRTDGVYRTDRIARSDFRLRRGGAGRPHLHGDPDRSGRPPRPRAAAGQGDRRIVHLRRTRLTEPSARRGPDRL